MLILTTFDLDECVYDALCVGASGFLLKDVTAERLFDAVRVIAAGEALLAPVRSHLTDRGPGPLVRSTGLRGLVEGRRARSEGPGGPEEGWRAPPAGLRRGGGGMREDGPALAGSAEAA